MGDWGVGWGWGIPIHIQLFRECLSHKSVKAYLTMFCLIEVQGDSATRNEKEGI